jgi:microsomal dipeptidase-like Zn-dependent dipeptidase
MTHVAHSAAANAAVVATHSTAAKVKPASARNAGLRPLFRRRKLVATGGVVGSFGFQHILHPRRIAFANSR